MKTLIYITIGVALAAGVGFALGYRMQDAAPKFGTALEDCMADLSNSEISRKEAMADYIISEVRLKGVPHANTSYASLTEWNAAYIRAVEKYEADGPLLQTNGNLRQALLDKAANNTKLCNNPNSSAHIKKSSDFAAPIE